MHAKPTEQPRPTRWPIAMLTLLAVALVAPGKAGAFDAEFAKAFVAAAAIALGAMMSIAGMLQRRPTAGELRLLIGLGGVWAYLAVVTALAGPSWLGQYQLAKGAGLVALIAVVIAAVRVEHLAWLARVLACLLIAAGALALAGERFGVLPEAMRLRPAIAWTFNNQNEFGGFLAVCLPLVIAAVFVEPARPWRFALVGAVAVVAMLAYATASRNTIACSVGGSVLMLALVALVVRPTGWKPRGAQVVAAIVVGVGIALIVSPGSAERLENKMERMRSGASSRDARSFAYAASWDMVTGSPARFALGHGVGGFRANIWSVNGVEYGFANRSKDTQYVHNEYLETLVDGGAVALLTLLVIVAVTLRRSWRLGRRRDGPTDARVWALAFGCCLVCFAAFGILSVATRYIGMQAIAALAIGGIWAIGRDERRAAFRGVAALPALVLVASIGSLAVLAGYFRADRAMRLAVDAFEARDIETARTHYEQVSVLGTHDPEALSWRLRYMVMSQRPVRDIGPLHDQLTRQIPAYRVAGFDYAIALMREGRYAEALVPLDAHCRAHPWHFGAAYYRCVAPLYATPADRARAAGAIADVLGWWVDYLKMARQLPFTMTRAQAADGITITVRSGAQQFTLAERELIDRLLPGELPAHADLAARQLHSSIDRMLGALGAPPLQLINGELAE